MNKLLLIDAHSLIHRCYHALPPLTNSKGEPTGALYGVASLLIKIITQQPDITHIAALFDRPEPTFRKQKYDDYKIHRPKADDELVSQLIRARELFQAFSIPSFELPGYEGDDLIGTFARRFEEQEGNVTIILTGDMDSLQLVRDDHIYVQTFKKGITDSITYDEAAVKERYRLEPKQLIDYKALVGDASDNIPGVAGIGMKTATSILQKYGTLDAFFEKGKEEKVYPKIITQKDIALLSRELATIDCNVPITAAFEDLKFNFDSNKVQPFLEEQNFISLIKRLGSSPTQNENNTQTTPVHIDESKAKDVMVITPSSEPKTLSSEKTKVGYELKEVFKKHNITPPYYDIKIACDLLEIKEKDWTETSFTLFRKELPFEEFATRGHVWTHEHISKKEMSRVFNDIELPLIPVLAQMEKVGIAIDSQKAKEVERAIDEKIHEAQEVIYKTIPPGTNLNSPKQLLEYFKKNWDPKIKSTGAEVLEKYADSIPVIKDLLAYRELFKLQSTYVQAIQKSVANDGRVHPNFVQIGAATGRIACQNPNLQNIPQESSWSADIRNIFIPQKGFVFVSADYSQIELRVFASLAQDKNMIDAFRNGEDIHALTASKIFNVPLDKVTKHMRRNAKTLNFGMVYGMGYRALAQTSGLSSADAKTFIKKYFEEFSSIKKWQEETLSEVRKKGYVKSSTGRVRSLPQIHAANKFLASSAEREAINMPIQGLAADILKLAMINIHNYIQENDLQEKIRMVLTIHDELVFEINENLLDKEKESEIVKKIQDIMENSYKLDVPIKAETKIGKRWGEME